MKQSSHRWHGLFTSSQRPLPITIISLLYLSAAVVTPIYASRQDWLFSFISTVLYLVMGVGLWRLYKWARTAEILVCYAQILGGAFLVILFYETSLFESVPPFYHGWIFVLFGVLCVINVLVIKYLQKPAVITMFSSK